MLALIVEDDPAAAAGLATFLHRERAITEHADTGEDGLHFAKEYDFDIILLDLGLPDMTGEEFIRHARLARIDTPILVLTGVSDARLRSKALSLGADDFVSKPYDRAELIARINAVLRRSRGFAQPVLSVGPLKLDLGTHEVTVHDRPVRLTGKEQQILELLMLRNGVAISKESFLTHLYSGRDEPDSKIIDVFICKLRRKLADAGAPDAIGTIWGRGYTIRDPGAAFREPFTDTVLAQEHAL
jgi:two-component system, cell cycle response regulator CtrA